MHTALTVRLSAKCWIKNIINIRPETFIFTDTPHHQKVKGIKSCMSRGYNTEFEKSFKADRSEQYHIFLNTTQCFGMEFCHRCLKLCHEFWESEGVEVFLQVSSHKRVHYSYIRRKRSQCKRSSMCSPPSWACRVEKLPDALSVVCWISVVIKLHSLSHNNNRYIFKQSQ